MTKKDGRSLRGETRRKAWAMAAEMLGPVLIPDGIPSEMEPLYKETLKAIRRFCAARGRGEMGPPPGGVGVRS